ncbi:MAG: sulfatase [Candidatus Aminicenantes bacterium]|nr:MAG: sulfatase [Candidatus Aminicenantes bacterium]
MKNEKQDHPNIILIVIDALRARNLGCYGGETTASPNIDELANNGIQFENCYACWNTTDQSLTSIFSGRYPRTHGIVHHGDKVTLEDMMAFRKLDAKLLAEKLRENGFKTLAVDWMGRWFKRGFDFYGYKRDKNIWQKFLYIVFTLPYVHLRYMAANISLLRIYSKIRKTSVPSVWKGLKSVWNTFRFTFELARVQDADYVTKFAQRLIDDTKDDHFFLFLHYWDTHTPYNCPKKYMDRDKSRRGSIDTIASKYKGAVNYVDKCIGDLITTLKNHQILEDTLIIITSDHGESLTEREMFFDHHGLYEVTTHVPLIFFNPKLFSQPKKIQGLIQHVDLVPTVCDYLGMNDKDLGSDGISLRPLISGTREEIRDFAFFEESYVQRKIGWRNKRHKYIYAPDGIGLCKYCQKVHAGVEELYDLEKDPEETHNVVSENKIMATQMRAVLDGMIQKLKTKRKQLIGKKGLTRTDLEGLQDIADQKKIKKKLRSLGYMD